MIIGAPEMMCTTTSMASLPIPNRRCFELIQTLNIDQMETLTRQEIRFILPCLVRMCHCDTLDVSRRWLENRRKLKRLLMPFPEVNNVRLLLDVDYGQLEIEVKKEIQLRSKSPPMASINNGGSNGNNNCGTGIGGAQLDHESYLMAPVFQDLIRLLPNLSNGEDASLIKIFETEDLMARMRLVLYEIITLMLHYKNNGYTLNQPGAGPLNCELFDTDIYVDEFVDLIYFTISEMPNTFQLFEVVESLLAIKNGLVIICRLVANFPDSFHEICTALINNSDSVANDETSFLSNNRVQVLRKLCQMNPSEALIIRSEAVELCRMPNLVVMLTLDQTDLSNSDVISFITGILLGHDDKIRQWFSQYIKRKNSDSSPSNCFGEFREQLLQRFRHVTQAMARFDVRNSDRTVRSGANELLIEEACLMLRLYCALRGVAMMKLNEDETQAISRMIVCRPPHIDMGVRFVSIGLCTILAFPQMINSQETEIIDWIKWLVTEENYFGQKANTKSSFGEMLLLIAIFFHSNQLGQIGELVSSTIGIKLPLRTNDLTLIKHIFVQDIFTEQTVASHAVKVPVTRHLNDRIHGALPIHCIYQLLKSRAFTKNRVPIKIWIFQQLCNCTRPVHHIVPSLIEAYVNSILVSNTQSGHMTNEPIAESDLSSVFNRMVYSFEPPTTTMADDSDETDDENDTDDRGRESDSDGQNSGSAMGADDDETEDEMDTGPDGGGSDAENGTLSPDAVACPLTSQLLFLYYVLLYEDVRLNVDRSAMVYSSEFMSRLPIFYLVQRTQNDDYKLLRPPLLRLISSHYPHLCLVKDWLPRPDFSLANHNWPPVSTAGRGRHHHYRNHQKVWHRKRLSVSFQKAFSAIRDRKYSETREPFVYLEQLINLPDELLWPLATDFIQLLPLTLDPRTPKTIRLLVRQIWFRLNSVFPTKLWLMTINVLRCPHKFDKYEYQKNFDYLWDTWDQIVMEPRAVLRCDPRVFRTPELMEITLHMLDGFLAALKIKCHHHILECTRQKCTEEEKNEKKNREELALNYQMTVESAAVQLLLECFLPEVDQRIKKLFGPEQAFQDDDQESTLLSNKHEVQGLVCKHLHQTFIAWPCLAKTVNMQGYPHELIPIAVAGIPSMHICLDFISEILQCLDLRKHAFAIDLTSHLCAQYPITRSLNVAKLCMEFSRVHLTVLPNSKRAQFYLATLPALERMCQTFPPLIEDFLTLLVQLAQRNLSSLASRPASKILGSSDLLVLSSSSSSSSPPSSTSPRPYTDSSSFETAILRTQNIRQCNTRSQLIDMTWQEFETKISTKMEPEEALTLAVHKAFAMVCRLGPLNRVFKDDAML